jgi:hypothetical protein
MNSEFQTHKHERAPEIFILRESNDARQYTEQRVCGGSMQTRRSREVIDVDGEGCLTSKLARTATKKNHNFTEFGESAAPAFTRTHALHEYIKNIILLCNLEREKGCGVE